MREYFRHYFDIDAAPAASQPGNKETIMARIIINARTYRESCLFGCSADDISTYDEARDEVFARIAKAAEERGHELTVDEQGTGPRSYRVESEDIADEQSAHEFMVYDDAADFWSQF